MYPFRKKVGARGFHTFLGARGFLEITGLFTPSPRHPLTPSQFCGNPARNGNRTKSYNTYGLGRRSHTGYGNGGEPMKDGGSPRRMMRRGATLAAAAVALGLSAFGLHRGWAAEPAARASSGRTISAAAVADRTVALANLEDGFAAIAERLEPSVVSITVDRNIQTASFSPDMPDMPDFRDFFRQFGGQDDT